MALKKTSEVIAVGFDVTESAAATFTEKRIDLQLNPLDNEVFVVLAIDLDPAPPEMITATNTSTEMSLSTTSLTSMGNLNQSQVLANSKIDIRTDAVSAVVVERNAGDEPTAQLSYIGIISTNDFFIQIKGTNTTAAKNGFGRVWGYRARADAATYAALVQSEVLSS